MNIDSNERMDSGDLEGELGGLSRVFREQLTACLEESARGRRGLFAEAVGATALDEENGWPEAARLRELALALQAIYSAHEERNALCDEFLDLCSISEGADSGGLEYGGTSTGERRLARAFLTRIEKGEVGTPTQSEIKPW
jgi:hypothetical protein